MDRTIGGLIGMDPPQPGHVVVNGWYYYGGLNLVPTSAVAGLGQLVRHIIPSFIVRPRKAVMAFPRLAGIGVGQAEREWRTEILPTYRALVERSRPRSRLPNRRTSPHSSIGWPMPPGGTSGP